MGSFLRLNCIVISSLLSACGSSSDTQENSPASGSLNFTGDFIEESTVTVSPNIADSDGLTSATYLYTWYADNTVIEGNTSNSISFSEVHIGQSIRVEAAFNDDRGHSESVSSGDNVVVMIANRSATSGFDFTGNFEEQQTLTVTPNISDVDGIENINLVYQWYADDLLLLSVTSNEISFTPADNGKEIYFVLSFNDDRGHAESITSDSYTVANKEEMLAFTTDALNATYGLVIGSSADAGDNWIWRDVLDRVGMDEVADPYTEIYYPDAATDNKGNIVVVTQSEYYPGFGGEYDVVYTHSTDNGATFSEINLINAYDTANSQSDEEVHIDTDGQGQWVAIWGSYEDTVSESLTGLGTDADVVYSVSTDNGASFSSPKLLNASGLTDNVRDRMPDITVHKDIWTAVWSSGNDLSGGDGTDEDIVYTYSEDQGVTWSNPAYINSWATTDSKTDYFPQIAMNSSGFAVTIWSGYNDGISLDIYAATSTDFGKNWNTPKLINQYVTSSNTDSQDYPNHVEVTEGNIAVISWEGGNPNHGSDEDVYFSVSTDMGENWSTQVAMNPNADTDTDTEDHRGLSIQQTQDGNWIAFYNDYSNNITFMRKSSDLTTWTDPVQIKAGAYEYSTLLLH